MLPWRWTSIADGGPTPNQHWFNVSCLLGHTFFARTTLCNFDENFYRAIFCPCNMYNNDLFIDKEREEICFQPKAERYEGNWYSVDGPRLYRDYLGFWNETHYTDPDVVCLPIYQKWQVISSGEAVFSPFPCSPCLPWLPGCFVNMTISVQRQRL